jgi:hypothetical protein
MPRTTADTLSPRFGQAPDQILWSMLFSTLIKYKGEAVTTGTLKKIVMTRYGVSVASLN